MKGAMMESSLNKINLQLKNLENKLVEYDNIMKNKETRGLLYSRSTVRGESALSNVTNFKELEDIPITEGDLIKIND